MHLDSEIWLCLSGGNALGSYHSGACEALTEAGIEPSAIAGASIGALVGAIIAGNAPENRMSKLKQFWMLAEQWSMLPEGKGSRIAGAVQTLMGGRPHLFYPRINLFGTTGGPNLFEPRPMRRELQKLVDFNWLNSGRTRFVLTAVDVENGRVETFDNRRDELTVEHLMASCAFPVFFPPVMISGKTYIDPGVVCNLPVEALFGETPSGPVTCLAFDAATPEGEVPKGLDAALTRAQDILFSAQSRHALARAERMIEEHSWVDQPKARSRIFYRPYRDEANKEASLKMLDFRRTSLSQRWEEGRRAMIELLQQAHLGIYTGSN